MFAAIYSFDVRPGREQEFLRGWEGLTKLIYRHEGSLGSRIHKAEGTLYIAYAMWPDFETWELSGDKLPPEAETYRKQMRDACVEVKTLHRMEVVQDLIRNQVFQQ